MHTYTTIIQKTSNMVCSSEVIILGPVIDTVLFQIFEKVIKSLLIVRLYRLRETFFNLSERLYSLLLKFNKTTFFLSSTEPQNHMSWKGAPANILLKAGLIRSGCSEMCPVQSSITPRVEIPPFHVNDSVASSRSLYTAIRYPLFLAS